MCSHVVCALAVRQVWPLTRASLAVTCLQVEYMRACENNRQLRMAVNDERRYRMIQLEVKKRIEGDLKKLQDGNIATASTIAATNRELKRVEEHVDAHKAWAAQQEAEEESKWRELGARAALHTAVHLG